MRTPNARRFRLTAATLMLCLLGGLAAVPTPASARGPGRPPLMLYADADRALPPPIDEGTEYEEPYNPNVYFTMSGGKRRRSYMIFLTRVPAWDFSDWEHWPEGVHCGTDVVLSSWEPASPSGGVAWRMEPATYYTPLHQTELCPGHYYGELREKRPHRAARVVRDILFDYPNMAMDLVTP